MSTTNPLLHAFGDGGVPEGAELILEIPEIQEGIIRMHLRGLQPLITNKFTEDAILAIEQAQQKKTKRGKAARNPDKEFRDAQYVTEDGRHGFPADGFKACIVRGAKYAGGTMTDARSSLYVEANGFDAVLGRELILFDTFEGPIMRKDPVKIGQGKTDIRYRPEYRNWTATVTISFNRRVVSAQQILAYVAHAGYHSGLGDKRREKGHNEGRFEIIEDAEYPIVLVSREMFLSNDTEHARTGLLTE